MAEHISKRADRLFASAVAFAREDIARVMAEHSAAGRLQSGATIKRTVAAFAGRSCVALDDALASASARVDFRGRQWRQLMSAIQHAVERHMDAAPAALQRTLEVAGLDGPRLAAPLLLEVRNDLHQRAADYAEGWTSPRARPWRERNAILYAVLMLVAGAAIGEGVKAGISRLFDEKPSSSATVRSGEPTAPTAAPTIPAAPAVRAGPVPHRRN